jgi:hypothetical protein
LVTQNNEMMYEFNFKTGGLLAATPVASIIWVYESAPMMEAAVFLKCHSIVTRQLT